MNYLNTCLESLENGDPPDDFALKSKGCSAVDSTGLDVAGGLITDVESSTDEECSCCTNGKGNRPRRPSKKEIVYIIISIVSLKIISKSYPNKQMENHLMLLLIAPLPLFPRRSYFVMVVISVDSPQMLCLPFSLMWNCSSPHLNIPMNHYPNPFPHVKDSSQIFSARK